MNNERQKDRGYKVLVVGEIFLLPITCLSQVCFLQLKTLG